MEWDSQAGFGPSNTQILGKMATKISGGSNGRTAAKNRTSLPMFTWVVLHQLFTKTERTCP
jgi:hypothetical protein